MSPKFETVQMVKGNQSTATHEEDDASAHCCQTGRRWRPTVFEPCGWRRIDHIAPDQYAGTYEAKSVCCCLGGHERVLGFKCSVEVAPSCGGGLCMWPIVCGVPSIPVYAVNCENACNGNSYFGCAPDLCVLGCCMEVRIRKNLYKEDSYSLWTVCGRFSKVLPQSETSAPTPADAMDRA